jgi:glycerol kinase
MADDISKRIPGFIEPFRDAASAAGPATGFWSGLDELRADYTMTRRRQPRMDANERADGSAEWRRAVDRRLGLVDVAVA